jgi:hypothetical protein
MADKDKDKDTTAGDPAVGEAPAIPDAADGGDSRLTAGYSDNPDAPPDAIAQVENLKDE